MNDDETYQLDLTESITDVPQANNIALFIRLLEGLRGGESTLASLAERMEVDERTIRYYADFGRWLGWVRPVDDGSVALNTEGTAFVESTPARGRLFAGALFDRPLVQTVQTLKRRHFADAQEPEATRRACLMAIEAMTVLSEATAQRRAGALASMLRWAYNPRQLDWSTGRPEPASTAPFDFSGQSFLTAYGARQFGTSREIHIGFPHQVVTFVTGGAAALQARHWVRASYDSPQGSARWFGSIPINPSTLAVARRGGPDLRRLLVSCNPYVAIAVALFTTSSSAHPPAITLSDDMYGLRLWHRDNDLGPPLVALARMATAIELIPIETVPHLMGRHVQDDLRPGTEQDFVEVLTNSGILRHAQTSLSLARGVVSELRQPSGDGPTVWERMEPLRQALIPALRSYPLS